MAVPDWQLERMRQGEIPRDESAAGRLEALERSDREILEAHPPAKVAAEVRRRMEKAPRPWRPMLWLVPAAAALAVVAIGRGPERAGEPEEITREKGMLAPHLVVHRRAGGGAERMSDHQTARPGDVLQLSYVAAGRSYGVILSLDGRGQVTLHLPPQASAPAPLAVQGTVPLPEAYELDDAPAFERFVFVTSRVPFDAGDVVDAARTVARDAAEAREKPLPLAPGMEQSSLLLEKKP